MVAPSRSTVALTVLATGLLFTSCGRSVGNSSPRVTAIPVQTTSGGGTFSLDLTSYVTDREGGTLTYGVSSGGGSFTGAVYSHTFDTLGSYTVTFTVTDSQGKVTTDTFDVLVQTANFAVVQEGDNLMLLDTDTQNFLTVTGSTGFTDTVATTLSEGHVVYTRSTGTTRLFVYNPATTETVTLGNSVDFNTAYHAKTSDDRVVFTRTATGTTDSDLYIWNPETGLVTPISTVEDEPDTNPLVTSTDLIYYESGSPSNLYVYDPSDDTATLVSAESTAETLRAVLPNDGIVFTRIGSGGESDLFYYRPSAGLVEIGADLSTTVQAQTKTYKGRTSTSVVVFEVTGASDIDLYVWDPSVGTSTAVNQTGNDDVFAAVTANDEVLLQEVNSGTDRDLLIYTHGAATPVRTIAASGDDELYQGALSNGDVVYLVETGTGDDLYLYDTSGSSSGGLATTSTSDYSFNAVLDNDKVVYTLAGASGGVFVVNTSGAPSPSGVGGPAGVFQGVTSGGDFVVQTSISSQKDLVLWDESAGSLVIISNTTGDDAFGSGTAAGDVLFTRVTSGKTTSDLFLWNAMTTNETQLTDSSDDHSVVQTFAADNS